MRKNIALLFSLQAMMAQSIFDPNNDSRNRFNEDFKHPLVIDPPNKPLEEPFPDCVQKFFDSKTKLKQENNISFNFQKNIFDINNGSTTIYNITCFPYITFGGSKGKAKKIRKIKAALENYVRCTKIEHLINDNFFIINLTHVFNNQNPAI